MAENRNDQMDRERYNEDDPNTLRGNEESRSNQPYQGSTSSGSPMNREQFEEQSSNPTSAQPSSQRRDEYSSPDDFDELEEDDELEDDEMISRVDVEDDMDILDDDENSQMNRQDMSGSGFNPDSTRNR